MGLCWRGWRGSGWARRRGRIGRRSSGRGAPLLSGSRRPWPGATRFLGIRACVRVDRANTTATVWLGSTLGCAQCHDHKFDPFTQKEYYGFFAFFNSSAEESTGADFFKEVSPKLPLAAPDPRDADVRRAMAEIQER